MFHFKRSDGFVASLPSLHWAGRENEDAAEYGAAVHLNVLHVNSRARELYERLGFVRIGGDEHHHFMRHPGRGLKS